METDTATDTMPPRSRRGGARPGAGRKPKPRAPRLPDVGDTVWYWGAFVEGPPPGWICRPAVVLWVATPGDPESSLTLSVFRGDRLEQRNDVAFSAEPREGCWSFPEKQGRNREETGA
jgi:hypothetical protein